MKPAALKVKVRGIAGPFLKEGLTEVLKERFVLQSDRSIPISDRFTLAGVVDEGGYTLSSGGILGIENKIVRGIFRLIKIEEPMKPHDILRHLKRLRLERGTHVSATTHELIEVGGLLGEKVSGSRIVTVERDEFSFIEGIDMPHASVLSFSEKLGCPVMRRELLYSFDFHKGDSILIWS